MEEGTKEDKRGKKMGKKGRRTHGGGEGPPDRDTKRVPRGAQLAEDSPFGHFSLLTVSSPLPSWHLLQSSELVLAALF